MNITHETGGDHLDNVSNFRMQAKIFYDNWGGNGIINEEPSADTPTATFEELLNTCKTAIAAIMVKIKNL